MNIEQKLSALSRSKFRSSFKLSLKEQQYYKEKGYQVIESHAYDFIRKRLAPKEPKNDGHQTPMKGHPVFVAQHATATCCRKCLAKWHHIPMHHELTEKEISDIVHLIMAYLESR